ncbi:MAG: hypothetical protein AB8G86_06365, partial [Saprospiraceae bacterium]
YELPLSGFQERIDNRKKAIQQRLQADATLFKIDGFLSTDSIKNFVYQSFDDQDQTAAYRGTGGRSLNISTPQIIFEGKIPNTKKGNNINLSFWAHDLRKFPLANTFVNVKLIDPKTGVVLWRHRPQIRYFLKVMANDGWSLVDLPFKLPADGVLEVSILNKAMEDELFLMDELIIRKGGTNLYRAGENYWNGRVY